MASKRDHPLGSHERRRMPVHRLRVREGQQEWVEKRDSFIELYSFFTFFSSTKTDKLFLSTVLFMLVLSWLYNALVLAQIAGICAFALFLKYVILTMRENVREADRKNPNFDHDSEIFTKSTLYMGIFTVLFGLPFTLIGISSLPLLGNLPQGNIDLFTVIEVFWQPFGYLLFTFVGLGFQYMGLYSCWRYFVQ